MAGRTGTTAWLFELAVGLTVGATLVPPPPGDHSTAELGEFLAAQRVEVVVLPASVLAELQPGCVAGAAPDHHSWAAPDAGAGH